MKTVIIDNNVFHHVTGNTSSSHHVYTHYYTQINPDWQDRRIVVITERGEVFNGRAVVGPERLDVHTDDDVITVIDDGCIPYDVDYIIIHPKRLLT